MSKQRDEMFRKAYEEYSAAYTNENFHSFDAFAGSNICSRIGARYMIGFDLPLECLFLEWCLNNLKLSEKTLDFCRERVACLKLRDNDTDPVLLEEVEVANEGIGCVITVRGEMADVFLYEALKKKTYVLKRAVALHTVSFLRDVILPVATGAGEKAAEESACAAPKISDDLDEYIETVKIAKAQGLRDAIPEIVPVIICDENSAYDSILDTIYRTVFGEREKTSIRRANLISGSRRYDSVVENLFRTILQGEEYLLSIDLTGYNAVDQLFTELITTVHAALAKKSKIICIRLRERGSRTLSAIAGKLQVFEIRARHLSPDEEAAALFGIIPGSLKPPFNDRVLDILKSIISAEKKSGVWSGRESMNRIVLKLLRFAKGSPSGAGSIDESTLRSFFESAYAAENRVGALEKMRGMVGMEKIVELAEELISSRHQDEVLRSKGIDPGVSSRHIVFSGQSGCGKTTAARLLAEALNEAGICRGFYECNARSICGQYLGETRILANAMLESAGQGVLFLDEAYSLSSGGDSDYGAEAIAVLLTEMENPDSNLVIIFAGYTDEMNSFLDANPGLRSRIGHIVNFDSFSAEELFTIALDFLRGFDITDEAKETLHSYFLGMSQEEIEQPNFGMARHARNIASKIKSACARRHWLAGSDGTDITREDVDKAIEHTDSGDRPRTIGFTA